MTWHTNALPKDVLKAAPLLSRLPLLDRFYLAGGTALALRLGHRVSVDLDFFSKEALLDARERGQLKEALSALGRLEVREEKEGALHVSIRGVETSFLHYPYPLLRKTLSWKGLRIASIQDIGLMKLGALIGRGARKDFRDLREICRVLPLENLLKRAPNKFPDAGDFVFQASKALVYFADAEYDKDPRLLKQVPWQEVRRFFEREVPRVFAKLNL